MCWVSNTYFLPPATEPQAGKREGRDEEISYYQWTAIILIALAVSWYFIALVWRFYISRHMDLETILKFAESTLVKALFLQISIENFFRISLFEPLKLYEVSVCVETIVSIDREKTIASNRFKVVKLEMKS